MLIFEFINVFIETVIILFYCGNIFEVKHSLSNGAKIAIIFGLLGILTFTGFLHLGTYINLALSYCACFIVSYVMYEGELKTKLFISAIYCHDYFGGYFGNGYNHLFRYFIRYGRRG